MAKPELQPGMRVEITDRGSLKGMRGTVQHKVGREWVVQLDQTAFGRNVVKWHARSFKVIEEPERPD